MESVSYGAIPYHALHLEPGLSSLLCREQWCRETNVHPSTGTIFMDKKHTPIGC